MIVFYNMPQCGFCKKTLSLLDDHIRNNTVIVKSYTEAPKNITGFPHFVNTENNKTHTGYPGSAENLFQNLDYNNVQENYVQLTCSNFAPYRLKNWQGVL